MADILDQIRSAFDGDDTPKKNLALRKAHDEIELLRVALVRYGDKPRMGMVAPMVLQQVVDAAFEHTPPPQPTEVSEGEDYRVGQHGEAAPADSCANDRTNFLRQTVSVHYMVSDEEGWKLDSTAPDHVQPPSTHVAGRCCWRRSSLSEAAQVFIRGLQCRAQANAKGEIGAEQVFDILDKTIVARGYLAGMAGDIASGAIGDLEAPATQTVCHDASAVPDLPVETGNTVPIFGQTERGECRLARGRINDHVSFCHGAPLVRRLRAAFLACPTAHGSPASTPLCWGGAGFKSGHAPNVRTDVNIREQRETEFYNASRNRVYPSPVTREAGSP